MKISFSILLIAICAINIHCRNKHAQPHGITFSVKETDNKYCIFADYNPEKTKAIESILDQYLKQNDDPSFINTQIDAEMTMSDKTTFHIKHTAGDLEIEVDKSRNSGATLAKFKEMTEQLKKAL